MSKDIIDTVKSHISHTYIKTKDIGLLGKKVGLNFLLRKPEVRPSRQNKIKLEKLGQKKNNYLIGAKTSTVKPIELLFYENHWMLFDEDIKYKGKKYNTYQFLKQLIKDGILKPMTMNDAAVINSKREVYLSTPSEIKLADFNPELFEFQQFLPQDENDFETKDCDDIFYADFECTTDGSHHQPYLCCIKKRDNCPNQRDNYDILSFRGQDCVKQLMNYLFGNFKRVVVIFHNLAYDGRLVRSDFNVEKALEKGRQIFTETFKQGSRQIKFIDSLAKIPYKLATFPKLFGIQNTVKEIFPYNYYTTQRVFNNPFGRISEVGPDEKPPWNANQKQQFIENLTKLNLIEPDGDQFDMMGYAEFYCKQDVRILDEGYSKFHQMFLDNEDLLNMNIDNFTTIPSIANNYFAQKVYIPDRIFTLSGVLKDFVMKSVQSG